MKAVPKARAHHYGVYAAGSYALLVVGVFGFTSYTTKPEYVGYDWIPFILLTWPWSSIGVRPALALLLNAAVLYLLGTVLARLRR